MLEIIALIFIGKKFRELSEKYNKKPWKGSLGAILIYIGSAIITAVTILIFFDPSPIVISLAAMPIGFGVCYLFYLFLENKWKKEPRTISEIEEIGNS